MRVLVALGASICAVPSIVVAAAAASQADPAQTASAAAPADYEAFCKIADVDQKRDVFVKMTPENQALLVRTQIERWRDQQRTPPLSATQRAFLSELLAFLTPEAYNGKPKSEEFKAKQRDMFARQRVMFTDDGAAAMQPWAPCIPKAKNEPIVRGRWRIWSRVREGL